MLLLLSALSGFLSSFAVAAAVVVAGGCCCRRQLRWWVFRAVAAFFGIRACLGLYDGGRDPFLYPFRRDPRR